MELKMNELFTNKILLSLLLLLNSDFINSASAPEQGGQVYDVGNYTDNDDDDNDRDSVDEGGDIVEKPFNCSVCNQNFSNSSNLAKHKKVHTGVKPFICDECGIKFNLRAALTRHKMIHAEEKPFECKKCDKCFDKNSDLARHMRAHNGEKPFNSDVCDKHFGDGSN